MASIFNEQGRSTSSIKTISTGLGFQFINLFAGFALRTLFLMILTKEYLGINGLFSNILSLLSFAELGIGTAIVYRMYGPINDNDIIRVAALMGFYKKAYMIIAGVVLVIGLAIMPALPYLIKDASEIPADVNLYAVYSLFLANSVASYFFIYKNNLILADRRGYVANIFFSIKMIINLGIKILILFLTEDYMTFLIFDIISNVLVNFIYSLAITRKYKEVFKIKEKLDKDTVRCILKDTAGILSYKLGDVLTISCDTMVLTAFVGLGAAGIYSNYSMIILATCAIMAQLFGTFTSSIGNFKAKESNEDYFKLYKKLYLANFIFASIQSISIFVLINPFVEAWLGVEFLFDMWTVLAIAIANFISQIRHVNAAIVSAAGLFVYDRWRPIAGAIINVAVSILLVNYIGIVGIFIGTIVSGLVFQIWREPMLIFRKEFDKPFGKYMLQLGAFFCSAVVLGAGLYFLCNLMDNSIGYVVLKFIIVIFTTFGVYGLFLHKTESFKFIISILKMIIIKMKNLCNGIISTIFKKNKIINDESVEGLEFRSVNEVDSTIESEVDSIIDNETEKSAEFTAEDN